MNAFLDFKPANGLDAKSLSGLILDTLKLYGLEIASCLVGQGFDGASVMSGVNKGVQQMVRQSAPLAIYVHCYAHKLNLILVDACKSVPEDMYVINSTRCEANQYTDHSQFRQILALAIGPPVWVLGPPMAPQMKTPRAATGSWCS